MASLLYGPAAVVVAVFCAVSGFSLQNLVTFGGALGVFPGMLAWWLISFAAVLPYAVFVFPWAIRLEAYQVFGLVEMAIFIVILALGLVYAWRKGVLRWV